MNARDPIKPAHVNRPSDATKMLLPGLVEERRKMYALRALKAQHLAANPAAPVPAHLRSHYLLGDGEVVQPQRPGSEIARSLPSRGFRT